MSNVNLFNSRKQRIFAIFEVSHFESKRRTKGGQLRHKYGVNTPTDILSKSLNISSAKTSCFIHSGVL